MSYASDAFVLESASVREAIEVMYKYDIPAVGIVDPDQLMLGLFTNGDMRRFFLGGGSVSDPITVAMNPKPICFTSQGAMTKAMEEEAYIAYPLIDSTGKLLEIAFNGGAVDYVTNKLKNVPLVIMAGGKGTRLYPYTKVLPKALIPIGDETISERIIDQFTRHGCDDVWFILNHKAEMIEAYFKGIPLGYETHFVREPRFLGTGGGLALLRNSVSTTFFLSNCDILINDDMACVYETHKKNRNDITFVCAMMNFPIPYGVIETNDEGEITSSVEKPEISYLINTGVYVVEPSVLNLIGDDEEIGFPDVAKRCKDRGGRVGAFPVPENAWTDIGEVSKMKSALVSFGEEA